MRTERHIPSLDTLIKVLGMQQAKSISGRAEYPDLILRRTVEQQLQKLRKLLEDWRDFKIEPETSYKSSSETMLDLANEILDGYGVEHLRSRNGRASAYYVNQGDPYIPTLMLDTSDGKANVIAVGGWGNWLEAKERRGNRFD